MTYKFVFLSLDLTPRYILKTARDYGMNFSKRLLAQKKRTFSRSSVTTSEREAWSEFSVVKWKNLSMSGPIRHDTTRHDTTRHHDAFDERISLQPQVHVNRRSRAVFFGG